MLMLFGEVVMERPLEENEVFSPGLQCKIFAWAKEHSGEVAFEAFASDLSKYRCSIKNCFIRPDEYVGGQVKIGDDALHVVEGRIVDVTDNMANTFNFVTWLEDFFQRCSMGDAERTKILKMPLQDFLGLCITAAEQLEGASPADNNGTPQPKVWGISKKALLTGQKVKCPQCASAYLRTIDGQVNCPNCQLQLGDIEELPDLI